MISKNKNMKKQQPFIIKASGNREHFSSSKLERSLKRAGARQDVINEIVSHIEHELRDGMTTEEIYKHAFVLLNKRIKSAAVRYSIRSAVMQLGPDGFPFERFIGEILKTKGFKVQVGGMLQGACVEHEVDVLAEKDHKHIFVEAKFHNKPGIKTDLKVALYVQGRFEDITKAHEDRARKAARQSRIHDGWLVTNTKLTSKAIEYSRCIGLTVIGWNYPKKGNLQDLIVESGVHPLTCLASLSEKQKRDLLHVGAISCRDLKTNKRFFREAGLDEQKISRVLKEVGELCEMQ